MKLAQLLKYRSDLRQQVHALGEVLSGSVTIGDRYSTGPIRQKDIDEQAPIAESARRELTAKIERLIDVTRAINLTNASELVMYDGKSITLTEALAIRDTKLLEAKLLSRSTQQSTGKWVVDRKELMRIHDNAARKARELDDLIQQANWSIDVG